MTNNERINAMKNPKIRYIAWCYNCKSLGKYIICLCCQPDLTRPFGRPSEYVPKR